MHRRLRAGIDTDDLVASIMANVRYWHELPVPHLDKVKVAEYEAKREREKAAAAAGDEAAQRYERQRQFAADKLSAALAVRKAAASKPLQQGEQVLYLYNRPRDGRRPRAQHRAASDRLYRWPALSPTPLAAKKRKRDENEPDGPTPKERRVLLLETKALDTGFKILPAMLPRVERLERALLGDIQIGQALSVRLMALEKELFE